MSFVVKPLPLPAPLAIDISLSTPIIERMFDDLDAECHSSLLPPEDEFPADARAVLAAVLANPQLLPALRAVLDPQAFDPDQERPLWLALLALEQRGVEITPHNAMLQIARQGNFSALGILPSLEDMPHRAPRGPELDAAVANLRRASRRRQVVALLEELIEIGLKNRDDPVQAVAAIQARVNAAAAQPPKTPFPTVLSARRLVEDQAAGRQPLWLLDRLLPAGGVSLLAGEVASGKTFLALDLAISAAAGLPAWGGRACLKSKVLYCCLDSSPRTIRSRVQALCAGRGIDPPHDLFFDFSPLNLAAAPSAPASAGAGGQERLRQMVAAHQFTLVVLDVLARYLPGVDENAVSAVGPVFSLLRSLAAGSGASFLVVHHFNKSAAARASRIQRVRGSSDIAAAVDAALSVTLSAAPEHPSGHPGDGSPAAR